MAKRQRVRKYADGGEIDPFAKFRARNPDLQLEPGLEQVDKEILGNAAMPVGAVFRSLSKVAGPAVKAVGSRVDLLRRPKITNRLYSEKIGAPEFKAGDAMPKYGVRNLRGNAEAELNDIRESGFMRARQATGSGGRAPKKDKYFTMTDNPKNQTLRVRSDKIPKGRAVRREDVEVYNPDTQSYEPLRKGGRVKKYARGGGIESRGKTKGRFV